MEEMEMHKTTSHKIIALGKNEFGGREQVADKLTEEEYTLLYAVLHKARRTRKSRIDHITYGPRLKRITALIEKLDFNEMTGNSGEPAD
jgi:hypothetical protein